VLKSLEKSGVMLGKGGGVHHDDIMVGTKDQSFKVAFGFLLRILLLLTNHHPHSVTTS